MAKKPAAKRSLPVRRDAGAKATHVVDHAAILHPAHCPPFSATAMARRHRGSPFPAAGIVTRLHADCRQPDLLAEGDRHRVFLRRARSLVATVDRPARLSRRAAVRLAPRVPPSARPRAFFSWDSEDVRGRRRALNIARLIVATTYIFSGLQKANLNFIHKDFLWFVEPITGIVPAARGPLSVVATAAPLIQVGFGIGLLTTRYRGIALVLAVSMAIEDLNVTPYPEPRVYRKIARSLCDRSPYRQDFVLLVREQRMFFSQPETGYRCSQL